MSIVSKSQIHPVKINEYEEILFFFFFFTQNAHTFTFIVKNEKKSISEKD